VADRLSASQIFTLLIDGGFSPDQARTMTAIAQAESARDPAAVGDVALQNNTFGPSVGLFQIRTVKAETGDGTDRDIELLTGDVRAQVQAAFNISDGGTNFRPWSTFNSGSFRKFLDEPLQNGVEVPAAAGAGADRAQNQDQAAPAADPFAIDRGRTPVAVADQDQDRDGLTDRFEALLGTDPNQGDSDRDGLSDAFESAVSHTDPTAEDTDKDRITDDVEQAQGTDAGRIEVPDAAREAGFGGLDTLDSDADGLSDGFEKRQGTNPLLADSDRDQVSDGDEFARGTDSRSADSNRDGLSDGFAAQNDLDDPAITGVGLPTGGFGAPAGLGIPAGLSSPAGLGSPVGLGAPAALGSAAGLGPGSGPVTGLENDGSDDAPGDDLDDEY
jgi:hypothetical protein